MPNPTDSTTVREHLRELQTLVQDSLRQWNLATDTASAATLAGQSNPNRLIHGNESQRRHAKPSRFSWREAFSTAGRT